MARYSNSKQLLGTWLVVESQPHAADDTSIPNLKGIEFTLDKSGSVLWKNECNFDFPPTFCDTYEIHSSSFSTFIRFAGFRGSIIEFRVEKPSHQELVLSFDSWVILSCKRLVVSNKNSLDNPFTLAPALEEGYFSDMEICAAGGQKFQVHKTILSLTLPDYNWSSLNELPEPVLSATLHFLYSQHLPPSITSQTAKLCMEHFQDQQGMENFVELCKSFLKNTAARSEILNLVKNIHSSLERMVSFFDTSNEGDTAMNAARLWQSIKLSLGEGVLVVMRFVQLCVTFTEQKNNLTAEERKEVVTYFRSQLPTFVSQVYRLLKCFRNVIGGLTASQSFVLASYVAPEVDGALSLVWALAIECRNITEQIIYSFRTQAMTGHRIADTLLEKELHKLKNLHEKLVLAVMFLSHKKEKFSEMSMGSQVRSVMRNINLFVEEIPLVIFRLEEIIASLDVSLSLAEFQFTFYNVSSKINQAVNRLKEIKTEPNVRALLQQICDLVQREELNAVLSALDLLDHCPGSSNASGTTCSDAGGANAFSSEDLSQIGPVCREPLASKSPLAQKVLHLLDSKEFSDLDFLLPGDSDPQELSHVVKAHRVILAARCRWFYRALLSGMREAIDRKITFPDCSAPLLTLFLQYLYGGSVDYWSITNEQLIELLIMADRFEVEQLSIGCQNVLASQLDSSNVLYMLAVADQCSASQLLESCINHIWKNADLIDKESIDELPPHLRSQVQLQTSTSRSGHHWMNSSVFGVEHYRDMWAMAGSDRSSSSQSSSTTTNSESSKESVDLLQELTNEMRIAVAEVEQEQQEQRLENCVSELQDILGEEVSHQELLRLALAADCDVNRAVNYFLAQSDPSNLNVQTSSGDHCSH